MRTRRATTDPRLVTAGPGICCFDASSQQPIGVSIGVMWESIVNANGAPQNLRPAWQPGQSGNPNGRPKGPTLTTLIRRALDATELCGEPTPVSRIVAECLAEAMIMHAIKGNVGYLKVILDRVEGPVRNGGAPPPDDKVVVYVPDNGRDRCDEPEVSDAELDAWAIERVRWLRDQDAAADSSVP